MNYKEVNKKFEAIFNDPIWIYFKTKKLFYAIKENSKSTPFNFKKPNP